MKLKNNQSGAAHLVAILLVILIVVVGVVGWKVWDNQKQDNTPTNNPSNTTTNNNTTNATVNEGSKAIEITALGVKVNDPDGRNLQLHAEKICADSCDDKDSYFIRDKNSDYFGKCQYATGVAVLEQSYVTENPNSNRVKYSKKVGASYIAATLGSNFQSPCGDSKDEMYATELRQYILDNLEAL